MIEYIHRKSFEFKMQSGQAVLKNCPFCGDTSYHLYCDINKGVYFCHKCNQKGNEYQLKKHFGDIPEGNIKSFGQITNKKQIKKIPLSLADSLHKTLMSDQGALDYLSSRNILGETILAFNIGAEHGEIKWISFPYMLNGECVNIKYRSMPPAEKSFKRTKDGMSSLFNQDCLKDYEDIVITEGEIDALSVWQSGLKNVVSIANGCSSFLPEWIDGLEHIKKIYLWFDNDEKGKKASREVAERLGLDRCFVIQEEGYKDANEYFQKNEQINLDRAWRYEIENVSVFLDAAYEYFNKSTTDKSEIIIPWDQVGKKIGRIEKGDLITVSGTPKTGKTTWCLNIATHNAKHDIPVLFYCLEMRPERLAKKILQAECDLYEGEVKIQECKVKITELATIPLYFAYNYKNITLDSVMVIIRQAVKRYGIKFIVFDNLHYLSRSISNASQEVALISRSFKLLAEELNIPIFLIAQPRKVEEDKVMSMNDLKDSSSIGADSDQVIVLYRKRIKSDTTGCEEISASYDAKTLVRIDASRYSAGGDALIYFKGEYSKFEEIEKWH